MFLHGVSGFTKSLLVRGSSQSSQFYRYFLGSHPEYISPGVCTQAVIFAFNLAGLTQCTLIEGPSHEAAKVGGDAEMKCTVSKLDTHTVYWQSQTVDKSEFETFFFSGEEG